MTKPPQNQDLGALASRRHLGTSPGVKKPASPNFTRNLLNPVAAFSLGPIHEGRVLSLAPGSLTGYLQPRIQETRKAMNWTELLNTQAKVAYRVVDSMTEKIDESTLGWRPESGENWMTVGQLLEHIKIACGAVMLGFATQDWSALMPDGDMTPNEAMPTAESQPTCESLAEFKTAIEKDRELAIRLIEETSEEDLSNKKTSAPWNPEERVLGAQFLECIEHLNSHKAQLFYYLKLQGVSVDTRDLWGV
ncbi:MAG: hypothetical protein ACI97A_002766 [Planctomycetota bacterium]|jgi:hypothetical protein